MPPTIVRGNERKFELIDPSTTPTSKSAINDKTKRIVLSKGQPYLAIYRTEARETVPLHAHSEAEVIVVLEGDVRVGDELCGPGSVVLMPADEAYELVVGDEALVYTVVRPTVSKFRDLASPK